ncbi:hypothetical protein I6E26_01935 [Anaerovibrio lipolyticus]|nr:hypothetical protein [Anaerovibrio lipolyticus]
MEMLDVKPIVYVVHCIDTEGPLYESHEAIFDLLEKEFGIKLMPTESNYKKLLKKELDFGDNTKGVYNLIDPNKFAINGDWEILFHNIEHITTPEFRNKLLDSSGHGWIYNWFCMDHVGFTGDNPRRRDSGHHKIFDKYMSLIKKQNLGDIVQFHHHPVPHSGNFHESGISYWGRNTLDDILTRKIIDRSWFPTVYRPGFHTERPDSNWFLEQWIPFDYANQAVANVIDNQPRVAYGRFGDWRHAPVEWKPYHPSHDDYQKKGECRRWITRCLNMYARLREINQQDVDEAFACAQQTGTAILAFTDHDYKNMEFDVNRIRALIEKSAAKFKDVEYLYSDAITAMRCCCGLQYSDIGMQADIKNEDGRIVLKVATQNDIFGPQPYLALKLNDGRYLWDNFDFYKKNVWVYTFDADSVPYPYIDKIGVATNNAYGKVEILNYDKKIDKWNKTLLN